MNRVFKVQRMLLERIAALERAGGERDTSLQWERMHLASCARNGYFLAARRGYDAELAAVACSVHDYGRIVTGRHEDHAAAGYEPVKVFLGESGCFTAEEAELIALAVKGHSSKGEIGSALEEIVKDADVLDCHQYGIPLPGESYRRRLAAILAELGL